MLLVGFYDKIDTDGGMMNTAVKKRLNYADVMKGLATIIIVCYHLLAPGEYKSGFLDHIMFPFLITFFFFSGYFYKPGKRSYKENVKLRAKRLLIPFVVYGVIFWLIGSVYMLIMNQITVVEALGCLRNFFGGCIWNRVIQNWFGWEYYKLGSRYMFLADFWFLPALFFASLIFFPIADRTLSSTEKTIAAVAGLFAGTGVLRYLNVDLPYNWQLVPFWAGFMLLGAFFRRKSLFELSSLKGAKDWGSALISLAVGTAIAFWREPILNTFRGFFPEPEFLSMALGIISSIFFIWGLTVICRLIENAGGCVKELAWVGRNSMDFYLFHNFFAWVISIITGFSLRYTDPITADVFWKSVAVTAGSLALCVFYVIVKEKIEERR